MRSGCKCRCLSRKSRLHLHLTLIWFLQIHHKYVNAQCFPLNPHEFQFRFWLVLVLVWVGFWFQFWVGFWLTTSHWVLTQSRYCRIHLCSYGHLLGTSVCILSLFAVKNLFFLHVGPVFEKSFLFLFGACGTQQIAKLMNELNEQTFDLEVKGIFSLLCCYI